MTRWLLASPTLALERARYDYEPISIEAARAWLNAGEVAARVGHGNTCRWIREHLRFDTPTCVEPTHLMPGDVALVVRLPYRVPPEARGAALALDLRDPSTFALGLLTRIE